MCVGKAGVVEWMESVGYVRVGVEMVGAGAGFGGLDG